MSSLLYYGPGARLAACEKASQVGRLLAPPFGDDGLSTAIAREIVELLMTAPFGDRKGVVIIGPMDETKSVMAQDVLLKTLEEHKEDQILPILWAKDLGDVRRTIRSRCLVEWADGLESIEENEFLETLTSAAWNAVSAARDKNYSAVVEAVKACGGKSAEKKTEMFVAALADCLSIQMEKPNSSVLWSKLRRVALLKNPTQYEILDALLIGGPNG